ncbi:MAG: DUF2283 domain-containing protein [Candidatus Deferrimicrobiaceae bacterium]
MRIHYDEKADALYWRLDDSRIVESREVQPGIILDYDEQDQVVGVEILGVGKRIPLSNLKTISFEVA